MSIVPPASVNLIEYSGRPWSDINFVEKDGGSSTKKSTSPKEHKATRLLPRKDCLLYGQFPKLENKLLLECDKCGMVLLPCVFKSHCNNPDHKKLPTSAILAAPSKSSNRNRKSATKPSTSYASVSSANNNHSSNVMLMVSKPLPPTPVVSAVPIATPLPVIATASVSNSTSSNKHKKNSKSNKRTRKEDKIEVLPPPPALQSPEVVHPKKIVKHDLEHVVATTISSSSSVVHPSSKNQLPVTISTLSTSIPEIVLKEEIKDEPREELIATSKLLPTVSAVVNPRSGLTKLSPPLSESTTTPNNVMSTPNKGLSKNDKELIHVKEEKIAPETINVSSNIEENQENSNSGSVVHMPMSPVAVVNIVPVQQYLQQYLQLPTQPIVVTIPCTSPSTHMSSYPKPLTVTTRAIRKIGNTYLLQSQRLDHQRAEIQAITRSS